MTHNDELSPAEREFRALLSRPAEYHRWAAERRRAWELENVVWLHGYRDGRAVWKRERPRQNADEPRPKHARVRDLTEEMKA